MNLLNALAIVDTKELMDDVDMEMLLSLMETVSFWENLKLNDPQHRFKWSFLRMMNKSIFKIVPEVSVVGNNFQKLSVRPYDGDNKGKWMDCDN